MHLMHNEKDKTIPLLKLINNKFEFYFQVSLTGAFRGGVCLFLEHPLDSIKTQWQNKLNIKSTKEVVSHIYSRKGISGFYNGFLPNLIRVSTKNLYRWPLMIFFPRFYDKKLPTEFNSVFPGASKIMTGISIANIEVLFLCPLDRIKIFLMTSNYKGGDIKKIHYFLTSYKHNLVNELYRGIESTFWRSNVSWVSFLYLDHKFKMIFRNFKKKNELSFSDLISISVLVGVGNLLATLPFDFVKTQMQKEGCIKEKTFTIIKNYRKEHGIRVLYTGWQFKMIQYILQSLMTVFTLDQFETKSKLIR